MKTYRITAIVSSSALLEGVKSAAEYGLDWVGMSNVQVEVEELGSHCPVSISDVLEHFKQTYGPALPQVREAK